ncbi:MAG: phenylalanine--tRNA ligase subunit alpha [Phycisphaerae bacterium]
MATATDNLDDLKTAALDALQAAQRPGGDLSAWYRDHLGRKGTITELVKTLKDVAPEQRAGVGKKINELKQSLSATFEDVQAAAEMKKLTAEGADPTFDVTLPGRRPAVGTAHPVVETIERVCDIFQTMGFVKYVSPEVETDEMNFGLLNMPEGHPARDMWDTFYTTTPGVVLRTHTSPGQIHAMRQFAPEPVRVILPGKVYRYEEVSARSESMFHQIEGLAVGKDITFANLKGVILSFAQQLYGPETKIRLRKSYFPFTEPSVEADVSCTLCGAKGCPVCKYTGWLEIMGAGMVHPKVLKNGGYDPAIYTGFAFGMGPDRMTMLRYRIDDIRYFFSNDARFLKQFG